MGSTPGDRRHNAHFIAIFEGGILTFQEANIFAVDVEIHKATQLPLVITQAGFNSGATGFQGVEQFGDRAAFTMQGRLVVGELLQGRGNENFDGHNS